MAEPYDKRRGFMEELRDPKRRSLARAAIMQGTWFTTPYYRKFKDVLNAQGVTWSILMEAFGRINVWFVRWAEGKITWDEVMNMLEKAVNNVIRERQPG